MNANKEVNDIEENNVVEKT